MQTTFLFSCIVLNHKIGLIIFAICVYLNGKVTSTSYPYVNIANLMKINEITTVYLESIISTYCKLSKWLWIVSLVAN